MYLVPLQDACLTSRGTISRAFAIISLLRGLLMTIVGAFTDRRGPGNAPLIGFAGMSVTFYLFSRMTALWHLYALVILQGLFILPKVKYLAALPRAL
jgi:MFS-type transporter involved in bile tolerance (Atg22 family)